MIDRCVILSALAMLCILYGVLALGPDIVEIQEEETVIEVVPAVIEVEPEPWKPSIEKEIKTYYFERDTTEDHIDEVQTALFYATVPIGRYYITAYSHMETGSKITASGSTVHQGIITTCAADPKYHRFGEYLEIGGRIYRVEDTGSAVKKRHIDIYIPELKKVQRYNSHYETIYKVEFPFGKPKDN